MANTYTQIYIHYIFAVQNRLGLIKQKLKNDYETMLGNMTYGYTLSFDKLLEKIKLLNEKFREIPLHF